MYTTSPLSGTNYAYDYTTEINKVTVNGSYSPCGHCGDYPINTCLTESDCLNTDGIWQNTESITDSNGLPITWCKTIPPPSCLTDLSLCLTEIDCLNRGNYWYDDICNESPKPTCFSTPSSCLTRISCSDSGFYWNGSSCVSTDPCTGTAYSKCLEKTSCEELGYYWYDGICNNLKGTSSHTLETLGYRPSFYINFSLNDPSREVTSKGRIFTINGAPSIVKSIETSGGSNHCYLFNLTGSADNLITVDNILIEDDFTIEMVINSSSFEENDYMVEPFAILGNNNYESTYVSVTDRKVTIKTSTDTYSLNLPLIRVLNTWYHLVIIRLDNQTQVYLNGQAGQTLIMNGSILFSKIASNSKGIFRGKIDEIAIYSYPFDQTQVLARSSYVISNP